MKRRRGFAAFWGLCATATLLSAEAGAETTAADPTPAPTTSLSLVRGRLTIARLAGADLVVAIDKSNSSLFASEVDVDGDGEVGRNRSWLQRGEGYGKHPASWTSDASDSVLAAELGAATALVDALAERSRIGVLTYRDAVKVRAPVGDAGAARAALAKIRPSPDWTGTNLARALDIASGMLDAAAAQGGASPPRAIVLFTDGRPTAPDGRHWASERALERARELASRGIAILAVPVGETSEPAYLAALASASGGSLLSLEDLRSLVRRRIPLHFDRLDLAIENLTLRRRASEVRVHPDGSFDGIVPLADGENQLEIRAALGPGSPWSERIVVRHEMAPTQEREDEQATLRQLFELRDRLREEATRPAGGAPAP